MLRFGTNTVDMARQSRKEISLKQKHVDILPPVVPHPYAYTTPPTGIAPNSGEIIHADNLLNKLAVNWLDLDGNDLQAGITQLTTGDFVALGGTVYVVLAPVQNDLGFSYVTVDPETQLPEATYTVRAWRATK